ncbi:hypothetical protein B0T22DRAFT_512543 [Podospora appendiculata]|uniref:Ig-like domain-containing protein n=1 Tax=Podospora appendiculata TaxID=314037 RepID=A0AAE0XAB4_9PEZI|nr:hypothetical protein B0T22DRAFT_512543 [Podospora appendiculata]
MTRHIVLAFAAATLVANTSPILAAGAPSTPSNTQAIANCTTNSFAIPSWFIEDFAIKDGIAKFSLLNRATNSIFGLSCNTKASNASSACVASRSTDASLSASVQAVKGVSATVQVQQSWTCDDRNPAKPYVFLCTQSLISTIHSRRMLAFTASGSTSVPLSFDGAAYKSTNPVDLIKGSLHSPVELTPAYADGPTGHSLPGCVAGSKTPTWTIGTVIFINETGDGSSAIPSQSIQFQVTNHANGHVAGCLMYFSAGPAPDDPAVPINCGGSGSFGGKDRYSITTEAVFYPRSWTFRINQTWYCDDVDAAKPVAISATGGTTLALNCTTDTTQTACQTDAVTIHGKVISETSLTPYSIEDPLPTPDGCTVSSIVAPSWLLSNLEVDRNATAGADAPAAVSFNMKLNTKNNLFDYPVFVSQNDVQLQGGADVWYPCNFGANELPLAPKSCSFQYHPDTNKLAIRADWVCIDIDAAHPILFNGISTTTLPKLACITGRDGLSACSTDENKTWLSEVADVTWKTLDALPAH